MSDPRSVAVLFAFAVSGTMSARAAEAQVTIPLKKIWALEMPGTRNVREMPTARQDEQIVESIRRALASAPDQKKAPNGFVVMGADDVALQSARDILVKDKRRTCRFPVDAELSAVFFSYQSGMYVHLSEVEREGSVIKIAYKLVPHESANTTEHFALIPLGALPRGKYVVTIEQAAENSFAQQGIIAPSQSSVMQTVCSSFKFLVEGKVNHGGHCETTNLHRIRAGNAGRDAD